MGATTATLAMAVAMTAAALMLFIIVVMGATTATLAMAVAMTTAALVLFIMVMVAMTATATTTMMAATAMVSLRRANTALVSVTVSNFLFGSLTHIFNYNHEV